MRSTITFVLLAFILLPSPAYAQHQGWWEELRESTHLTRCHAALSWAQVRTMLDMTEPVLEVLRHTRALAPPQGMMVRPRRIVHAWPSLPVARNCWGPQLILQFHRLAPPRGCAECQAEPSSHYGGSLVVNFNDAFAALGEEVRIGRGRDSEPSGMFLAPREVMRIDGIPVYEGRQRGWWMLLARGEESVWRPVTRERYLAMRLDEARQQVHELEANRPSSKVDEALRRWEAGRTDRERTYEDLLRTNPEHAREYRETMERMEAEFPRSIRESGAAADRQHALELARARERVARIETDRNLFTPAELQVEAWCCDHRRADGSMLLPPGSSGHRVVEPNPVLLDRLRAAGQIHLLTVRFNWSQIQARDPNSFMARTLESVRDEVDWAALRRLTQ
jgi:hypothetical protein